MAEFEMDIGTNPEHFRALQVGYDGGFSIFAVNEHWTSIMLYSVLKASPIIVYPPHSPRPWPAGKPGRVRPFEGMSGRSPCPVGPARRRWGRRTDRRDTRADARRGPVSWGWTLPVGHGEGDCTVGISYRGGSQERDGKVSSQSFRNYISKVKTLKFREFKYWYI